MLYQINTRVVLRDIRPGATLDDLPDALLDEIAGRGFTWVWMLGVWQTGPAGRRCRGAARLAGGLSPNPARPHRRRHLRLALRHPPIHRQRRLRRPRGAGPLAPEVPAARHEFDARLRAQPHRSRSPLGDGASRVAHPRQRGRPGPRAAQLGLAHSARAFWPTAAIPTSPAGPTRCN